MLHFILLFLSLIKATLAADKQQVSLSLSLSSSHSSGSSNRNIYGNSNSYMYSLNSNVDIKSCVFPASDYKALLDLYDSTSGPRWTWKDNQTLYGLPWNFSAPFTVQDNPCITGWQYLTCTYTDTYTDTFENNHMTNYYDYSSYNSTNCSVSVLNLKAVGMSGTLPTSIGTFMSIDVLSISYSPGVTGTIPHSIGNLTTLSQLNFEGLLLTGTIPASITNLTNLNILDLSYNYLSGQIPVDIGKLCLLKTLNFQYNVLGGTLPESIGDLSALEVLYLQVNHLRGTIPARFGYLRNVTILYLTMNKLTGTIPSTIQDMTSLKILYLYSNTLTGTIPFGLSNLRHLVIFSVLNNLLTGTIPNDFGSFLSLQRLYLAVNYLTGSLPESMADCTSLIQLDINQNYLSQSIPGRIFGMPNLKYVYIFENAFSGTISPFIANASMLSLFFAQDNLFSGSLPPAFYSLQELASIDLSSNQLTGGLSYHISNLNKVYSLKLGYNQLSGSVPESIDQLKLLQVWDSSYNQMTGIFPLKNLALSVTLLETLFIQSNYYSGSWSTTNFSLWTSLNQLNSSNNNFFGTLPSSINQLIALQIVDLTSNHFSGPLNMRFSKSPELIQLLLGSNAFTGDLNGLVDPSFQKFLFTLDLTDNLLTGNLVDAIFSLPLRELAVAKNCILGDIPPAVCLLNQTLITLALDGLYSAEQCVSRIFDNSFLAKLFPSWSGIETYQLPSSVHRKVPSCLFNFSRLDTLHLSGNGIKGTLPDIISRNNSLSEFIVSHNIISGTIPLSFQNKHWKVLDLSFNKLTGILDNSIAFNDSYTNSLTSLQCFSTPSLTLSINRLSGDIPESLESLCDINILTGNKFQCTLSKHSLPQHDTSRRSYECGSNSVNTSLYTWLVSIALLVGIVTAWLVVSVMFSVPLALNHIEVFKPHYFDRWGEYWRATQISSINQPYPQLLNLSVAFFQLRRWVLFCVLFIAVFATPVYYVLSTWFSTYEYGYAWTISLAFKSGVTPAVCAMIMLLVFSSIAFMYAFPWSKGDSANVALLPKKKVQYSMRIRMSLFILVLMNIIVVLTVNMVYVYAANASVLTSEGKQLLVMLLSLFKIIWNHTLLWLKSVLTKLFHRTSATHSLRQSSVVITEVSAVVLTYLSFFNNIVAPCIAVALISPECFYYVYNTADPVDTSYQVSGCKITNSAGLSCNGDTIFVSASFTPPYAYSYQCSSSLLSAFADVFVFRYVFGGIISTFGKIFLKWIQSRSNNQSLMYHYATTLQAPFARPLHSDTDSDETLRLLPWKDSEKTRYSNIDSEIMIIVTDVSILLAFGTLFPPLAIVGLVSIYLHTWYLQFFLGRLVVFSQESNSSATIKQLTQRVEEESKIVPLFINQSITSLPFLIIMIWSFFLFDTVGDGWGFENAIWVFLLMGLFAILTQYCCGRHTDLNRLIQFISRRQEKNANENSSDNRGILLTTTNTTNN